METVNKTEYVFQTDSDIVLSIYNTQPNYLIEYDEQNSSKECCVIYFCSNDIYYPNTEEIFRKRIIEQNFFEWYKCRIKKAYKHIFIRDVFKQWYLSGINKEINSPDKLLNFIKEETNGYKIIMVGSSAGAYASILYGSLLGIEKVIAFNPQFEIESLLNRSSEKVNPLLFRLKRKGLDKYFNIVPFINQEVNIYYFYSDASQWDVEQQKCIKHNNSIHQLRFCSGHHGIPFLKIALPVAINIEKSQLDKLEKKKQYPILFTIKMVGIRKTVYGLIIQVYQAYKKRH